MILSLLRDQLILSCFAKLDRGNPHNEWLPFGFYFNQPKEGSQNHTYCYLLRYFMPRVQAPSAVAFTLQLPLNLHQLVQVVCPVPSTHRASSISICAGSFHHCPIHSGINDCSTHSFPPCLLLREKVADLFFAVPAPLLRFALVSSMSLLSTSACDTKFSGTVI